ncbi:MAG: DUF6755 family protein [Thermoanaerobaculia bacterium]
MNARRSRTAGRRRFSVAQRRMILSGITPVTVVLVVLQLWLLTATMNAHLGGDDSVALPAALASFACLLLNAGLLFYVFRLDGRGRAGG